ncbi:MAG: flagellar hook-basal body complex protein FliE [Deltaproteobacteria bacterium]|nr:flagellar hook-basal body complex protein FliE [Deltaproteobacteria bacterium]
MNIEQMGLKAYTSALRNFAGTEKALAAGNDLNVEKAPSSFGAALTDSLAKVNTLQTEKGSMIKSFASGENQNVHELMISMQKAGLAMNLTTAVRNKVLEAYRELSRLQF